MTIVCPAITPLDDTLTAALTRKIDGKTKPVGALGRLETLALQLGRVQQRLEPQLVDPRVYVFAGDHGLALEGVSAYPQEVTWQMVMNFLGGGAAVNVLARVSQMSVRVVDAGVAHTFAATPGLVDAKIAPGTRSSLHESAMTLGQTVAALQAGVALLQTAADEGCTVVAMGEMGIANTSAAALLLHKLADVPMGLAVGRGTGLEDAGLAHKHALLERAAARTGRLDALAALTEYGGFEIAMMAGAMMGAASRRMLVLVDGFIAGSAMLVAARLAPAVLDYAVFSHQSAEAGHGAMLRALDAKPLLALDMRLGEGTGAVLAYGLVRAAAAFLNDMASFESAGVSHRA